MLAFSLSKSQSKVWNFIQGSISRGISANESLSSLIDLGQGIRRTDYLEAYRYASGLTEAGYKVQNVPHKYYPDYTRFPDSATNIRREFSLDVRIGVESYDEEGNPVFRYVTVTTDRQLTVQEILDEAETSILYENDSGDDIEPIEPVIERARKRGSSW